MKSFVITIFILLQMHNVSLCQNSKSLIKYFEALRPGFSFYDRSGDDKSIEDILSTVNNLEKSISYVKQGSVYVGILNNFFHEQPDKGDLPNHDKYLFVFFEETKICILYLNLLHNDKTITDTVTSKDFFMPNETVEGYIFDSTYNFLKSFRVYPKSLGKSVVMEDVKNENKEYLRRSFESDCKVCYEDFVNGVITEIKNHTFCIIEKANDQMIIENWHSSNNPDSNFFIRNWKKTLGKSGNRKSKRNK